jgi:hypothetical protein
LFFASGPNPGDVIGDPIYESTLDLTLTAGYRPLVPDPTLIRGRLQNPPDGTTHLLSIIDRGNVVSEANEDDNHQAIPLPDYEMLTLTWMGTGGARFRYNVLAGQLPGGGHPNFGVCFASGPTWSECMVYGNLPGKLALEPVNRKKKELPASRLKLPPITDLAAHQIR